MSFLFEVVGSAGALLVLVAFVLSSLSKLSRGSYRYMFINGLGSLLLLAYAIDSGTIVFAGLNVVWLGIELYYLSKKLMKR